MKKKAGIICMTFLIGLIASGCSKQEVEQTELTINVEEGIETQDNTTFQKGDNDSVTYTLEGEDKKEMLKSAKQQIDKAIESIEQDEAFSYVKKITYNKDVTEFTVKVDGEKYSEENDMVSQILENVAQIWHEVNGTQDQEVEIIIKRK